MYSVSYLVQTLHDILGTNGTIELVNYEKGHLQQWEVNHSCDYVQIKSTHFDTEEGCDILSIGNLHYSGNATVDTIVSGSFNVTFRSNSSDSRFGLKLYWSCISMKQRIRVHRPLTRAKYWIQNWIKNYNAVPTSDDPPLMTQHMKMKDMYNSNGKSL